MIIVLSYSWKQALYKGMLLLSKLLKDFWEWQRSKKTLKDFDGIESHPIILENWMDFDGN
jgi:hypothetical protein